MTCGPGRRGDWIVPDGIFEDACRLHDEGYANPGDRTKVEIDAEFRSNMVKAAKKRGGLRTVFHWGMAWVYWAGVRFGGRKAWKRAQEKEGK